MENINTIEKFILDDMTYIESIASEQIKKQLNDAVIELKNRIENNKKNIKYK